MPYTTNTNWLDPEDVQKVAPAALLGAVGGIIGLASLGLFRPMGEMLGAAGRASSALRRAFFRPRILMEYGPGGVSASTGPSWAGTAARAFGRSLIGGAFRTPRITGKILKRGAKTAGGLALGSLKVGVASTKGSLSLVSFLARHPILFGGIAATTGAVILGSRGKNRSTGKPGLPADNLGATGDLVFSLNQTRRGG